MADTYQNPACGDRPTVCGLHRGLALWIPVALAMWAAIAYLAWRVLA